MLNIVLIPSFHLERDLYLNLLYIAHFLEKQKHRVTIFDVNRYYDEDSDEVNSEKLVNDLIEILRDADIVGMSSYKMYINNDREIYNIIREYRPDIPVIVGGWGPTLFPEQYLRLFKKDTVIVRGVHGQGLRAFLNITSMVDRDSEVRKRDLTNIKSVGFLDEDNNIILTELDDVMSSEELPVIDWRIERFNLNVKDYVSEDNSILVPVICAMASCPKYYKSPCIYCSIGKIIMMYREVYGEHKFINEIVPKLTRVSLSRVISDITNAYKYFVETNNVSRFSITLVDDCMLPHVLVSLVKSLSDVDIIDNISSIKFQTRPELVPRIISLIRREYPDVESKLVIDVGVEFFNDNDLIFTRRGYDVKTLEECLKTLEHSSVEWTMYVILASPVTSPEDLARNIEYSIAWSYKAYLLRVNPYLFEEGSLLSEVLGEDKIVYTYIDDVKLPLRPRFLQGRDSIRVMIELVDYYISYVEDLCTSLLRCLSSDTKLEKKYRVFLQYQSLRDLAESLKMLRDALVEDLESLDESQRRLSSSFTQ